MKTASPASHPCREKGAASASFHEFHASRSYPQTEVGRHRYLQVITENLQIMTDNPNPKITAKLLSINNLDYILQVFRKKRFSDNVTASIIPKAPVLQGKQQF